MSLRKKYLIVSFYITNSEALKKIESHWKKRDATHSKFLGRNKRLTKSINSKEYGGCIALIDPNNFSLGFLSKINIPITTGMYFCPKRRVLYVGSYNQIKKISRGKIIGVINDQLLNDIHGLSNTIKGNLLVVSTGVDAIIEIDLDTEKRVWAWLATENGYDSTPSGKKRNIDRTKNYQNIDTCTPQHTTHINNCLEIESEKILATLFHQGELVEINKITGKSKVLVRNLKCPHHIRKTKRGFILSDTLNQQVLLLNKNYKIIKKIKGQYNWIQDALPIGECNIIIADSNNSRLVNVDYNGKIIDEFKWDRHKFKVSSLLTITSKEVKDIFGEYENK